MRSSGDAGATIIRDASGVRLVLDDGRSVNILTESRLAALARLVRHLAGDPEPPRWLAIEGNPRGSFAAGADLERLARLDPLAALDLSRAGERLMTVLEQAPFPVGCLVDGHAVGGGFDLALSCDLLVATRRSWFAHPGIGRGFFTGWGGTDSVPFAARGMTGARALLAASRLDAADMLRAGLLGGLAPDAAAGRATLRRGLAALGDWSAASRAAWRRARRPGAPRALLSALARVDTPRPRC